MPNENETLEISELGSEDNFDFDDLEAKLQSDLEIELSELKVIKDNREKIGNPENLGKTVMNVVWEQFQNQIAVTAGADFIRDNRGLTVLLTLNLHFLRQANKVYQEAAF